MLIVEELNTTTQKENTQNLLQSRYSKIPVAGASGGRPVCAGAALAATLPLPRRRVRLEHISIKATFK